jgi:hypothetical protein
MSRLARALLPTSIDIEAVHLRTRKDYFSLERGAGFFYLRSFFKAIF